MVNGKQKGGQYERDKSRQLSNWITNNEISDILWRTSGSGSKATTNYEKGNDVSLNHFGDIGYSDVKGKPLIEEINIECKKYKDFELLDVLKENKTKSEIEQFWEETCKDAIRSERYPILIMKKNYFPELIMLDTELFAAVREKFELTEYIIWNSGAIVLLDKFLDRVSYDYFMERVK